MLTNDHLPPIILASASPRRKELLASLGLIFTVMSPDVDEAAVGEGITDPAVLVETLAKMKAQAVADAYPDHLVIGADTVVVIDDQILGKPSDAAAATTMLKQLQGNTHQVITGLAVYRGGAFQVHHGVTTVWMNAMTDTQIQRYVASGEPMDKAGAYAIQGLGSQYISKIDGCYFNVVGLSLSLLRTTLQEL